MMIDDKMMDALLKKELERWVGIEEHCPWMGSLIFIHLAGEQNVSHPAEAILR
jgi:hypothetical protein